MRCSKPHKAVEAFERATNISRDLIGLGYLGHAYGLAGRKAEAIAVLNEILHTAATEEVPQTSLAYVDIGLGDFDRAFEALERCLKERNERLLCSRMLCSPMAFELMQGLSDWLPV